MAQSAKGLFRATGKVSKSGKPRETMDFYATPPEPLWALLASSEGVYMPREVWEPAVGDGAMARQLRDSGRSVVASDILDRGYPGTIIKDFFDFTTPPASAIVTNPPYNAVNWRDGKGRWVRHAMEMGVEYMALLLNWSWPGAAGLAGVWRDWPPARVYLMRWKIDFTGEGAPPMLHGWFVWDDERAGTTDLRMLDRAPRPDGAGRAWLEDMFL